MPATLNVRTNDEVVKAHRENVAQRVLDCFDLGCLDRRLVCFLDDHDWHAFKMENGVANRGFYSPVRRTDKHWQIAPDYVLKKVFPGGDAAFDDFIYLHGTTCDSDLSLTMTFAHELQHFVQHARHRRLWAANTLVPNLTKEAIRELGLKWCDLPHEREARIVSKSSAEKLFGTEAVRYYIDERIAERVTPSDGDDWECVQGLVTTTPYDLANETKLFFPRLKAYAHQLKSILQHFQKNDRDFADVDLEALIIGNGT